MLLKSESTYGEIKSKIQKKRAALWGPGVARGWALAAGRALS